MSKHFNKDILLPLNKVQHGELQKLAELYTANQAIPGLNKLSVQDLIRLLVKTYLQEVRGQSKVEKMRARMFPNMHYLSSKCPNCLLRLDKQDFPVLVDKKLNVQCQVCGYEFTLVEEVD
jgi:hypothetical protein